MAFVGGPGWELYVPVEMTRHVYLALMLAGADLGVRDAGYCALDALRIEAGLAYAVSLDKSGFIGREALLAARGQPLPKKLVTVVLDDPAAVVHAGTPVSVDLWGEAVGARAWGRWKPVRG